MRRGMPGKRHLSNAFAKFIRPVGKGPRELVAFVEATFVYSDGERRTAVIPVKLGRMGRARMKRLKFDDMPQLVFEAIGRRPEIKSVEGFAHLLPRSRRRGIVFGARKKSPAPRAAKRRRKARR